MIFRKVDFSELTHGFFKEHAVYERIGNGDLSRVYRATTIDIGDLHDTEFYVEVKEQEAKANE